MRPSYQALALGFASYVYNVANAASILFTDTTIVQFNTTNSRIEILYNSSLLVEGDRISEIYNGTTPGSYPSGTEVVNATGKIISPGFIDTHRHLWQTAFKTIASNTSLAEYFQRYSEYSPTIQYMTPEDKYLSQLTGCLESLNAGTTTVLDHAHGNSNNATADAIFNATLDSQLRTYHAFAIHQLPNDYSMEDQINKLVSLAHDPRLATNSLVNIGLAFDSFDASSSSLVDQLWKTVQNENLSIVTTHTLRGPWILSNSPSFLNTIGWLNTSLPVVFAHASYIASSDMAALRSTNQYISTTPESEMHYGHGHPYVHLIQDQAALGVDTHFTYSADMVGQARLWLQNLRSLRYEQVLDEFQIPVNNPMSVEQAFYLITRAGGLALRRTDLGIIAPGAKADLVIFDGETPNMLGWADAVAAIVLHSNVGDIEHVLVGGDWVKRDRRLLFDGYDGVKKRFVRSARRIQQIWRETDWPPLDQGLWQNATKYGYTQEIDTLRGDKTGY